MAKAKVGIVLGNKMAQTVVVSVESVRPHPMYHKAVRKTKKFHVHDEIGVKVGDRVEFVETRPRSRSVKWAVTKVVTKSTALAPEKVKPEEKIKPAPKKVVKKLKPKI